MLKVRWNTDQGMKMYRLQMYVVISTVLSKWIYSCVIWMTSSNTTYICPFIVMLVLIISKFIWGQILIILFTQFVKIKETMKLWVQLHLCTLYWVISCTFSLDQTDSLELSFFFLLKFRNETDRVQDNHFWVCPGTIQGHSENLKQLFKVLTLYASKVSKDPIRKGNYRQESE